ncbi:hypothetical protein NKR23_g10118 [Pleurostoma richardsiae]|uniref:Uncharacterized protein n=1 Tax=Pleurostoma richardsiae TaxID=41990 RepID=A0AA38R5N1_9PEZI|nr:hypothetical protein NKR23_g10118 [Pleurostoma richardsiae]
MSDQKTRVGSPSNDATPSKAAATTSAASSPSLADAAPPGHAFRRAATVDEASQFRRRSLLAGSPISTDQHASFESPLRRRSSNFSDYSIGEARRSLRDSTDDILNPRGSNVESHGDSDWAGSLPLAFALLPAAIGMLFQNGSSVTTDAILLCLAGIFLRYTVTQPWQWYHSAQEVRVREELASELVFDDDSEGDMSPHPPPPSASAEPLKDVPEEDAPEPAHKRRSDRSHLKMRESALRELYVHEVLALISCFVSPAVGAYLLHTIRAQLSRPSEGLVSNFNLTIFLMGAELAPLSHALKLLQARTLHLQRLVNDNPYKAGKPMPTPAQWDEVMMRLAQLESRTAPDDALSGTNGNNGNNGSTGSPSRRTKQDAALVREVRNTIQPELDALNRAVRRYEKKATVLAFQTESRLGALDTRVNDAVSLAAAAAKHSGSHQQWSVMGWIVAIMLLPFQTAAGLITLPFKTLSALLFRRKTAGDKSGGGGRGARNSRTGQAYSSDRDRVPSRLSKR